jgi:O-acetylserine/cysteine efflux transporter
MKPIHIILMLCTVAVWGFNFVATRVALEIFSPEQMAFARSVLTLAILLPWWKPFKRIPWQLMAAALAIGAGSFYLLYQAISITESLTTVAVGTQLMPPLSAILALLFFHEHISSRKWLGILIATMGAVYLAGATTSILSLEAMGMTILSVFLYSGASIIIGKSKSVSVWSMLAWIAAMSLLPLGLMAAVSGPLYPDLNQIQIHHWLALLFAVVFSALFGQAVLFSLYRRYPVSDVAPWVLLIPFFAGLSSILVYGESISISLFLGGAIVLLGVWVQQSSDGRTAKDTPAF